MKKLFHILLYWLLLLQAHATAPDFKRVDYIQVFDGARQLSYPWLGGLNSTLFGKADMDHDNKKDLVIYDKTNDRFWVLRNPGLVNSIAYVLDTTDYHFPSIEGWFILKDYNCDNIEDFFTYSGDGSITVYKGVYAGNKLTFVLQQKGFYFQGFTGDVNVYNINVDKPALVDMNSDGDLDVLTFNVSGNRIIYYENQQKELLLTCDSLYFKIGDNCWGNIFEDGISPLLFLRDTCNLKFPRLSEPQKTMHVGSTLEVYDINGDGKQDALLGDVSLNNFNYLRNEGTVAYASFLQQDTSFPSYDVPLRINYFPVPYFLDIDNDNKIDLVSSSYDAVAGANINSIWYYKNLSADSIRLQLQQKDFLLKDMIDAGEGSHPCLFDFNNDGLKDIIIGHNGYKDGISTPLYKLRLYKNTGTANYPYFTLENDNYLKVDSLLLKEVAPAAGDLDNDGDTDIVAGLNDGKMVWWENTAGVNQVPVLVYKSFMKNDTGNTFTVGANAMPAIMDINNDNKNDLIIGERNGNLNYYKGFSNSPLQFQHVTDSLGKIKIVAPSTSLGYTAPTFIDLDNNNKPDLVLGNYVFGLLWYKDVEDKLATTFGIPDTFRLRTPGYRTTPVFGDLSNDGKQELILGNLTGGLQFYSLDPPPFQPVGIKYTALPKLNFDCYPNPSDASMVIVLGEKNKIIHAALFNILGQQEYTADFYNTEYIHLDTQHFPNGVYLLKISSGDKQGQQKIIIQHK